MRGEFFINSDGVSILSVVGRGGYVKTTQCSTSNENSIVVNGDTSFQGPVECSSSQGGGGGNTALLL